ncbi:MAG: hypothetical protein Q8L68_02830 [Methylococcales bacterium]|nr:hypothetical protein [Methylococcales bacterium]
MNLRLFLFRRWDDLTHVIDFDARLKIPKKNHIPLSTKEMKQKLQSSLSTVIEKEGFSLFKELYWSRPHPIMGFAILGFQTTTKYAPEFLGIWPYVGFQMPSVVTNALEIVCGSRIVAGKKQKNEFTGQLLHRVYFDSDRPKRRLPFSLSYTLFNTDFQEKVINKIKQTIQLFAFAYFDSIKNVEDLKKSGLSFGVTTDNLVVLLYYHGEVEFAMDVLKKALQNSIQPEMKVRLERLRTSIETGELQKTIEECSKAIPPVLPTTK